MDELIPIHSEVWDKLDALARENYQLKRANTKLRGQLGYERRLNRKLRKQTKPKQYYKNNSNRRNGK